MVCLFTCQEDVFNFDEQESLGVVQSVDTANVIVQVTSIDRLRQLQVNRLVALQSSKPGQYLIGIVQRITRTLSDGLNEQTIDSSDDPYVYDEQREVNLVRITLIGTLIRRIGSREFNKFKRTLESVPEIASHCFPIEGKRLTQFMRTISYSGKQEMHQLSLGHYTLDEEAGAFINGNRFFQRHALIVGSTGSGKSWTTALLLEQIASLPNANAIVLDIHGEYSTLESQGFRKLRIAGPADLDTNHTLEHGIMYLPHWLLGYEDMIALLLDRTDQSAPNQSMILMREIITCKKQYLEKRGISEGIIDNFTIDSPIPYSLNNLLDQLNAVNTEMVRGERGQKQGEFYGKLSRLIARIANKSTDRRLGFMFQCPPETNEFSWLERISRILLAGTRDQFDHTGGVKIIDFSEVPSDILPIIVGLVARVVLTVQQWTKPENRHPVAIFCDEAHLYMPNITEETRSTEVALRTFTRIAKEGRKYGVGLVVISQRPAEVNRTVLSQCNNVVAMRLTNAEDQTVIKRLLPDNLAGFSELLPILDVGEALVVGDACLLPSRIRISEPMSKPRSATVDFWDRWALDKSIENVREAVMA